MKETNLNLSRLITGFNLKISDICDVFAGSAVFCCCVIQTYVRRWRQSNSHGWSGVFLVCFIQVQVDGGSRVVSLLRDSDLCKKMETK